MTYKYTYKEKDYFWYTLINLPDFKNVSFPVKESSVSLEALERLGITRYEYIVPIPKPPTLDELKQAKLEELQSARDLEEEDPVATSKGIFEFDAISRVRLSNAMLSMTDDTEIRNWTTYDNKVVNMTKSDFNEIFAMAAQRSDISFSKYNSLKVKVLACTTKEEIDAISWDIIND